MIRKIIIRLLRILAAVILFQILFFKFTANKETVYIFSTLGIEPFGRISSAIIELVAVYLLLVARTPLFGTLIALSILTVAILTHLFVLGIEVNGDEGHLFYLALLTFTSCIVLILFERKQIIKLLQFK